MHLNYSTKNIDWISIDFTSMPGGCPWTGAVHVILSSPMEFVQLAEFEESHMNSNRNVQYMFLKILISRSSQ